MKPTISLRYLIARVLISELLNNPAIGQNPVEFALTQIEYLKRVTKQTQLMFYF